MRDTAADKRVVGMQGEVLGSVAQAPSLQNGHQVVLVERSDELGGGTIVLPSIELEDRGEEMLAPYGKLSIREAPPYSPNVPFDAYLDYWRRLQDGNVFQPESGFVPTGSGPVAGLHADISDEEVTELVRERIENATPSGVAPHLIELSVRNGTVLLQGYQSDATTRLAAAQAAAAVAGVREVVNMLIIRPVP